MTSKCVHLLYFPDFFLLPTSCQLISSRSDACVAWLADAVGIIWMKMGAAASMAGSFITKLSLKRKWRISAYIKTVDMMNEDIFKGSPDKCSTDSYIHNSLSCWVCREEGNGICWRGHTEWLHTKHTNLDRINIYTKTAVRIASLNGGCSIWVGLICQFIPSKVPPVTQRIRFSGRWEDPFTAEDKEYIFT